MARKKRPRYPLHQSHLFMIKSPAMLAVRLNETLEELTKLQDDFCGKYTPVKLWKKDGNPRFVVNPHHKLKNVQTRIKDLLNRVELPHYVHNLGDGRSHVTNAASHIGQAEFLLLDVADFYPSVTWRMVYGFFLNEMQCAGDVATILSDLVCHKDALPQGSPCSPIIAFWTTKKTWDAIAARVESTGNVFSLYADDLSVSAAANLPSSLRHEVIQLVEKSGLRIRSEKRQDIRSDVRPPTITGSRVGPKKLQPQRHVLVRIRKLEGRLAEGAKLSEKEMRQLRGLRAHKQHVRGA